MGWGQGKGAADGPELSPPSAGKLEFPLQASEELVLMTNKYGHKGVCI